MEFTNTFENGMHKDNNVLLQPQGTYRDMNNGMLVSYDGNHYVVELPKGTQVSFTLPANYRSDGSADDIPTPIGFISFLDKLLVFSTNSLTGGYGEIGLVEFDNDGFGEYTPLYYHVDLNFAKSNQIRGFTYEENDRIKRAYWTDNNTQPKAINVNDANFTPIISGNLIDGEDYMVVGGIITYDGNDYGPGLDDVANNLYPNIFTAGAVNTFATADGNPIVYKYTDIKLLDWTPDRENPSIDFKEPITGSLNGGSKSYFVRYKLKNQGVVTSWSYGSFPINVYNIDSYSDFRFVEGTGAVGIANSNTGVRLTISDINTYYDTIELAVATFDETNNTLTDAYIITSEPITASSMDIDHTAEGGEALTLDDLTIFPASIFRVKDLTTNKNYNIVGNIEERSELTDLDGTSATVSDLIYYMPADKQTPAAFNAGLNKQSSAGIASGGIIPDGKYVVNGTAGVDYVTYMGNVYGPGQSLGQYFTGHQSSSVYVATGTPTVKACILIKKYQSIAGFDRYKCVELNDDYFDYRGMAATQYLRQYWSGETYRIGVMPYDKKGNPMYVRWIGDHQVQTLASKSGPSVQRGAYTSLRINGIKISGLEFSVDDMAKISGFSIVRAPRDKQYYAQGILFPTVYSTAIRQQPLATFNMSTEYGAVGGNFGTIFNWYSPDEMFSFSGFDKLANNRLEGDCFIDTYSGATYQGPTSSNELYSKFYNGPGSAVSNSHKITRFDVVNPGSSIDSYSGGLDYDNNKVEASGAPFGTADAVGCRTALLTLDAEVTGPLGPTIGNPAYADSAVKILMNYKITKGNLYGGQTDRALANTIYISTGHYQRIDAAVLADTYNAGTNTYIFNEIEVFGGDSFLGIMSFGKSLYDNVQYPPSFSYGIFFPVESNVNHYLRQGRNINQYGMHNNGANGVYYDAGGQSNLEQFAINDAYASDASIIAYPALPDVEFSDKFPYRVRWAGPKTLGEQTDSFRSFGQNQFRDLDGNKGEINNVRERDDKVFYWQDRAVGYLPILERQLVGGDIGEATQLGVGGVIDRFDSLDTYFGNQNTNGLVETEFGFCWFDYRRRAMLAMTVGGGIQEISFVKGLQTFFNDSSIMDSLIGVITDDQPILGNGICGVYDPMYKMTYLCFKWIGTEDGNNPIYDEFTIGYYHPRNIFVGFFNLKPAIWHNHNKFVVGAKSILADSIAAGQSYSKGDVVSKDGVEYVAITDFTTSNPVAGNEQPDYVGSIYWTKTTQSNEVDVLFSTTDFCKFFGYTYDHDITVIVNPKTGKPFTVDNFRMKSNDYNYDSIVTETDDDTASEVMTDSRYYRYIDRSWNGSLPMGSKGRLVDFYLKAKLTFNTYIANPSESRNLQKVFNFVTSVFREKR